MATPKALILVVDDNPTNIKVLFDLLERTDYRVLVATDGESALQKLQLIAPDLILLDVMMPGIDGFEVCRRLKQSEATHHIPVIFMTALSDETSKVKGLNLGAVDYITKPVQHDEALARIRIHLQLRELTQQLAEKNELLARSNQNLEDEVKSRTAELSEALELLQKSQLKSIQQEKMSSLGQLVAGVAHEINNPVNFIYGNLKHANEYIRDMLAVLNLYQDTYPSPPNPLQELMDDVDLEFVAADLPKLMESMNVGAKRIRGIVAALRTFSRTDEAEYKAVDIHEGIDSTLMILQHRIKLRPERPAIEVIRDYAALPHIACYAGQLNQVFMNLLSNAIDALEDASEGKTIQELQEYPNQITIRTSLIDEKWVQVAIADNGPGIPKELQERIFEPFFTTKPIGKGTGMGLSISYQIIVEQHQGKIECVPSATNGTEFVIQIPIEQ
jgi:signal transduction histidine kinase